MGARAGTRAGEWMAEERGADVAAEAVLGAVGGREGAMVLATGALVKMAVGGVVMAMRAA